MTHKEFFDFFIKAFESEISKYGFTFKRMVGRKVTFQYKVGTYVYEYYIRFLNIMDLIELSVSFEEKTIKKLIRKISPYKTDIKYLGFSRQDYFTSPINKEGYFVSNASEQLFYDLDSKDNIKEVIQKALARLNAGLPRYINNTNSIAKLDTLINNKPVFTREHKEMTAIGTSLYLHGPDIEIITGVLAAYLNKNPNIDSLLEGYGAYMDQHYPQNELYLAIDAFVKGNV